MCINSMLRMLPLNVSKDTDKVIKAEQRANNLFVVLHNDMNLRADAFIYQLCEQQEQQQRAQIGSQIDLKVDIK